MSDITLTFNGVDLSGYLSTYAVTHEVETADSVVALDGTEYVATRRRPVVSFSFLPITDAQAATIYAALSDIVASATYTDPNSNSDVTATMRVASNIDKVFCLKSTDGNRYYKGGTITLRQRTVL